MRSSGGIVGGASCKVVTLLGASGLESRVGSIAASSSELESDCTGRAGADFRRGVALVVDSLGFATGRGGLNDGALRFAGIFAALGSMTELVARSLFQSMRRHFPYLMLYYRKW